MKRIFSIITALSLLLLCACAADEQSYSREYISAALDIDVSDAEMLTSIDSHEGFHGDGTAHIMLTFSDDSCLEQIEADASWNVLPLTENLSAIVYGTETGNGKIGPYITFSDDGQPSLPQIENGWYYFADRHSASTDPHDDSEVLSRSSFNLTIAIYDTDTNMLHYIEFDT